jgi:hypothetical protein
MYNYILLYTYLCWSPFYPIRRNVTSVVESALPGSLMRLDRLQRRSEIGSEREVIYLYWKSNSEHPLGMVGLHPRSRYHFGWRPSARVSQTLRFFYLSHMI